MTFYKAPHPTIERARKTALQSCIREKGNSCLAYAGVDCENCIKRSDGLKRRKELIEQEQKETIKKIEFYQDCSGGSIKKEVRLRFKQGRYYLEFGRRYREIPEIFFCERSIDFNPEELKYITTLIKIANPI